jgi:hypothetical protein
LAFSITISATCTWRVAGSSKVEATTSPLHRALHVGDFLGPLVDQQHDQVDVRDGWRRSRGRCAAASPSCRSCGGATIRPRWPLPIGRDDVDDAAGDVLFGLDVALELERARRDTAASGSRTGSCACAASGSLD